MIDKRERRAIDRIINLKSIGGPKISPDGTLVAYAVGETDWEQDRFVSQIWMVDVNARRHFQVTQGDKGAHGAQWSPDGKWLAFLSARKEEAGSAKEKGKNKVADTQIWLISPAGGEAVRLTASETGVNQFQWSPDGTQIAFSCSAPESKAVKERKADYSDFEVVDEDLKMSTLWVITIRSKRAKQVYGESERSVEDLAWSPDGQKVALTLAADPRPKGGHTCNIYVLDLKTKKVRQLVKLSGPNNNPTWSPDGKRIAFHSAMGREHFFYTNTVIAAVSARGGKPVFLTEEFDESASIVDWGADGIYFSAFQKTARNLFCLRPEDKQIARISAPEDGFAMGFDFTADYKTVTFMSADANHLQEIYVSSIEDFKAQKLTRNHDQVSRWKKGSRELVQWQSKDGAEIEGVLYKPDNFNRRRKHPLLVCIHGGPAGISLPMLNFNTGVYPVAQWLERGAVILCPNYRGSAGYGEAFRSLNVRNLGVGDMWDVMSGVKHLVSQGFIDEDRMGAMGWSQGGYISAFLTTNTDCFKAISVGAGISNWMTYYVNTDIPPFTRQYLKATPWDDPEIYATTSPMTTIRQASTPTLIQHGENDRRVPIPNAYELRQGLEDQGVPVKMIVYKGFGHGLSKPKAIRAAMTHNLEWFDKWIFKAPRRK